MIINSYLCCMFFFPSVAIILHVYICFHLLNTTIMVIIFHWSHFQVFTHLVHLLLALSHFPRLPSVWLRIPDMVVCIGIGIDIDIGCEYLTWWFAFAGPLPDVKLNRGSANVETYQFVPRMGQGGIQEYNFRKRKSVEGILLRKFIWFPTREHTRCLLHCL